MAIQRGENEGILTSKILVEKKMRQMFDSYIRQSIVRVVHQSHEPLFVDIITDCYTRLVNPAIQKSVR
jgi:transcriptional accessory protein Tex/SPT6